MTLRSLSVGGWVLGANSLVCILLLYLPIVVLLVFSFNSASNPVSWQGFSLAWYQKVFANPTMLYALMTSAQIAIVTAFIATVVGLMLTLALQELNKKYRASLEAMLMLPLIIPEIVSAIGLLICMMRFYNPGLQYFGLGLNSTVAIIGGHVSFSVAYVVLIIKARLSGMDSTLPDAAINLGASPWQAFLWIQLPQLLPAMVCAFVLVFTLSLDDFYFSHFLTFGGSGNVTLPVYLFGLQARSGLTPEMNAVAAFMMIVSLGLVLAVSSYYLKLTNSKRTHPRES